MRRPATRDLGDLGQALPGLDGPGRRNHLEAQRHGRAERVDDLDLGPGDELLGLHGRGDRSRKLGGDQESQDLLPFPGQLLEEILEVGDRDLGRGRHDGGRLQAGIEGVRHDVDAVAQRLLTPDQDLRRDVQAVLVHEVIRNV
jgi:hypothetical protein